MSEPTSTAPPPATPAPTPLLPGDGPVGLIGIGNMGFAMLQRLRARGWSAVVHDIDPQRMADAQALGADLAADAGEVAAACAVVIVAVVDGAQTREVLFGARGLANHTRAGTLVLLCPTLGPDDVVAAAQGLATAGATLVDAPMSGGPVRAREGTMSLMLAGPEAALARLAALLADLSSQRFALGPVVGDAARTKLVNNLLAAINLAGAAEAVALAQQLGLDARRTLAVIQASSGQSWIGQDRLGRALDGDFAPRAHTALLAKDTRLALQAAAQAGLAPPALGQLAASRFAQACQAGDALRDDACLFLHAGGRPEGHRPQ